MNINSHTSNSNKLNLSTTNPSHLKVKAHVRAQIMPKDCKEIDNIKINAQDETVRITSFDNFPEHIRKIAIPAQLAKEGFVYTGIEDKIKCFSCGRCVHKFEPASNAPYFQDWHKNDCKHNNNKKKKVALLNAPSMT